MKFFDFERKINNQAIFTAEEVKTIFYNQENIMVQISFWVKKGYLKKIEKGVYILANREPDLDSMLMAGKIYYPSYLSLEFALNYYGIIPDIPGTYTSVTSRKTKNFQNEFGNYSYQQVKQDFFTGYNVLKDQNISFNFATPEKAMMDYLYLNKDRLVPEENFWQELRINEEFKFNKKMLNDYKKLLKNKKVTILLDSLLNYQKNVR
ncbi:MAG: hypothetical protein U9Q72_02635 [Patescibacteria group bacterium]|nr:hypothetical protein [Patescibacteria group bacterium]